MKKYFGTMAALCLLFAGASFTAPTTAMAQDQASGASGLTQPPKVLVIEREFLKPGKQGSVHEKSEDAFVQAAKQANSPEHYIGVDSLSGPTRAEYFFGYNSLADWERDLKAQHGNSAFDSAEEADGELLKSFDTGVFVYQADGSLHPAINVGQVRYWEIVAIRTRIGHDADMKALIKLHNDVYGSMPNAHWAMWQKAFGTESGGLYIVTEGFKSLAEVDANRAAGKQAAASAGADQMKQMDALAASAIERVETNLYAVNPKMSYPRDDWKSADPGFWGGQQ